MIDGMGIKGPRDWPRDWDPNEGWPNTTTPGAVLCRSWKCLDSSLRDQGTSLLKLSIEMGATHRARTRTIFEIKKEIRAFVKEHGQTPTKAFSRKWRNHDLWLRKRGFSLGQLCVEMGYPSKYTTRTISGLKKEIRAYVRQHGRTPTCSKKSPKKWRNHDSWLRGQSSSLAQLCVGMGYSPRRHETRTILEIKKEIRAYVREHGETPTQNTSKKWASHSTWLRTRQSSLRQCAIEMGYSPRRHETRTIPEIKKEIRAYVKEHGKLPTTAHETSKTWANHNAWLHKHKTSLPQLCVEMGYHPTKCTTRTIPEIKKEIRAYVKEHGKLPTTSKKSPKWRNHDQWLRRRGISLARLCAAGANA